MNTQHSLILYASSQSCINCQALKHTQMGKGIHVQAATSPLPPVSAYTHASLRLGHVEKKSSHLTLSKMQKP